MRFLVFFLFIFTVVVSFDIGVTNVSQATGLLRRHQQSCNKQAAAYDRSSSSDESPIFDRLHERGKLASVLSVSPASITVILGPRSCGKSTFLRDYILKQELDNSICYIDCRRYDVTTPDRFAEVLARQGLPALTKDIGWKRWEQVKMPVLAVAEMISMQLQPWGSESQFTFKLAALFEELISRKKEFKSQSDLQKVIEAYESLLKSWDEARKEKEGKLQWPVIVIDEANVLQAWSGTHELDLGTLLRFFVGITKDRMRCHVILVTSEYGFQYWLDRRIGDNFYDCAVIGDFTEADARVFFEQQPNVSGLTNEDWSAIYEVCGGNPGNLRRALVHFGTLHAGIQVTNGNWTTALERVAARITAKVKEALCDSDGWTAVQFADAALLLLSSSENAVTKEDMEMQLGKHLSDEVEKQQVCGRATLEALVMANRLSLRPDSDWALDIPQATFTAGTTIVTAPSAVDLHAFTKMRPQLEQIVHNWEDRKKTAALRLAHPENTTPDAVAQVQNNIAAVSQDIAAASKKIGFVETEIADIKKAKKDGWQAEVAALRAELAQLRGELAQLRAKETQLREERLLLLKREGQL